MSKVKFQASVSGPGYGYVYVMSYPGDDKLKIGHSLDPFDRAKDIGGTKAPNEPIVEAFFWCSERREDVEKASHRIEKDSRHNGEWFAISLERALEVIQIAARSVDVEIQLVFDKNETAKELEKKAAEEQQVAKRRAEEKKAAASAKEAEEKHLAALVPKCMNCGTALTDFTSKDGKWIRCRKCGYDQIKR